MNRYTPNILRLNNVEGSSRKFLILKARELGKAFFRHEDFYLEFDEVIFVLGNYRVNCLAIENTAELEVLRLE